MQKVQAWGETLIQTTYFFISSEPDCNIWFLFILVYLDISHADCFPFSELIVGLPMTAFCVFIVIFRPLDKCCGHKRSAKLSNWGSCEILQNISIFFFFRLNKFVCLTKDSAEIICSAGMKEIIFLYTLHMVCWRILVEPSYLTSASSCRWGGPPDPGEARRHQVSLRRDDGRQQ